MERAKVPSRASKLRSDMETRNKRWRRLLNIWFITCLLPFGSESLAESEAGTLKVGVIASLTGDGAYWGSNFLKGAELAVRELNAGGGVNGKPVELVVEDDQCNPINAVTAAQRLLNVVQVPFVLGPVCSSPAAAVVPLAKRAKIPMMYCAEGADVPSSKGLIYRLWAPNDRQGALLGRYAGSKFPRVAILSVENRYGDALSRAFVTAFEKAGGTVTAHQQYSDATTDFGTVVAKIVVAKPDAVLLASYMKDGMALVRALRQAGYAGQLLGSSTLNSQDFIKPLGSMLDGMILADIPDTTAQSFRDQWRQHFNVEWPGIQSTGSLGYDGVMLIAEGVRRSSTSKRAAHEEIQDLRDYQGVTGPLSFDQEGNLNLRHELFVLKDNKVQPMQQ